MNTLVKFLPALAVVTAPALADTTMSVPRVSAPLGERITIEHN